MLYVCKVRAVVGKKGEHELESGEEGLVFDRVSQSEMLDLGGKAFSNQVFVVVDAKRELEQILICDGSMLVDKSVTLEQEDC